MPAISSSVRVFHHSPTWVYLSIPKCSSTRTPTLSVATPGTMRKQPRWQTATPQRDTCYFGGKCKLLKMMNKVVAWWTSQNEPQCAEKQQRSPGHMQQSHRSQRYVKAFYGSQSNIKTLNRNLWGNNMHPPPNSS